MLEKCEFMKLFLRSYINYNYRILSLFLFFFVSPNQEIKQVKQVEKDGDNIFEIPGKEMEPRTTYVFSVRSKFQEGLFSDSSEEYEFKTRECFLCITFQTLWVFKQFTDCDVFGGFFPLMLVLVIFFFWHILTFLV